MRSLKRRVLFGVLASTVVSIAGAVWANNYPDQTAWYPDNREHWGCWDQTGNIPTELWDHLVYFEAQAPGTTSGHGNMTLRWEAPCTTHTDVKFKYMSDDGLNNGLSDCELLSGSGGCDRAYAHLNAAGAVRQATAVGITYARQARKTWCHEMGHTLGLGHKGSADPNDCMRSGGADFTNWDVYSTDHSWGHVRSF